MKYLRSLFKSLHFKLMLSFLMAVVISLLCYQFFNEASQRWTLRPQNQGFFTVLLSLLRSLPVIIFVGILLYFYSRRFILRIRRLTTAAHSWSQGDFFVTVEDNSKDEIGRLTWHLN